MMSNNDSFGGKLRKVLASMCSLFVGASGVSQAVKPDTSIPTNLKLDKDEHSFGFWDFGWRLESGDAKKENSWLVKNEKGQVAERYHRFGEFYGVKFDVGFLYDDNLCSFCIWDGESKANVWFAIPKGILFDVMRYFECKYYPDAGEPRNKGTKLSCAAGVRNENSKDEIFLRFILWAFCGSRDAIKPNCSSNVDELKAAIFDLAVKKDNFDNTKFMEQIMQGEENGTMVEKKYGVLRSGYFLENFSKCVCDVYKDFKYDTAYVNNMSNIINQLEEKKKVLDKQLSQLEEEKKGLKLQYEGENKNLKLQYEKEKKTLESQKRISCALVALGALVGGGALVEGTHRFFGAKRSGSSGKSKDKISSNGKNGQKARNNLKK